MATLWANSSTGQLICPPIVARTHPLDQQFVGTLPAPLGPQLWAFVWRQYQQRRADQAQLCGQRRQARERHQMQGEATDDCAIATAGQRTGCDLLERDPLGRMVGAL